MSKKTKIDSEEGDRKRGFSPCAPETPFPDGGAADHVEAAAASGVTYIEVAKIDDSEDGNPRKIVKKNLERLKKSITDNPEFFEARPVLLNHVDGVFKIIGGHQRLKAAKAVGLERVPCFVFEGLDEEKAKRFTILDNTNEGAWDWDIVRTAVVRLRTCLRRTQRHTTQPCSTRGWRTCANTRSCSTTSMRLRSRP